MVSAHVCLLALLVYIVEQTYGYARVQLNISLVASTGTTRFSACLSEDGVDCKGNYRVIKWTGSDIERRKNRTHVEAIKILVPWDTMKEESKMFLILRSTAGGFTTYDVSHLTARDGELRDIKFDSLRLNFTLSCWPGFFGRDCSRGCAEGKDMRCDPLDGSTICFGSKADRHGYGCKKPLCLKNSTFYNGACVCEPGWTGRRCDQVHYEVPRNSMLPFALLVAVIALLSLFTIIALVVAFRSIRSRRPRQTSVADSVKSSNLLLSVSSSDSSSADSEEKMIE